jgi:hypothetical protein
MKRDGTARAAGPRNAQLERPQCSCTLTSWESLGASKWLCATCQCTVNLQFPDFSKYTTIRSFQTFVTPSLRLSPRQSNVNDNDFKFMSSTGQAASSTSSSASNVQLILDALANYAEITGIDLSNNPFAAAIEQADSPERILHLLQERAIAFGDGHDGDVGDGNQRLASILNPAVRVLHAFSGVLGEAGGMVSHTCHLVTLLT